MDYKSQLLLENIVNDIETGSSLGKETTTYVYNQKEYSTYNKLLEEALATNPIT